MTGFQRLIKRLFINQPPSSTIHDPDSALHFSDALCVDQVLGFCSQRHMHRQEVGLSQDFVELFKKLDLKRPGTAGREVWVVGNRPHSECDCAPGNFRPDASHSDDANGFSLEFDTFETLPIPFAILHAGVGLRDAPGDRYQQ